MFFLTTILGIRYAWPSLACAGAIAMSVCVFWEFGAPGHDKRVWNGLGALVKRTVRQDIIDGVVLTQSKQVSNAKEVLCVALLAYLALAVCTSSS